MAKRKKAKRQLIKAPDAGPARRIAFMQEQTDLLLVAGKQARRVLRQNANKGKEAEEAIRKWLRGWLEPDYTISSGEILDSVEPAGDPAAREQDGIVHVNTIDARVFSLPSGMRLVPIETVVATVDVKLSLTKKEFDIADRAATELRSRQLALVSRDQIVGENSKRVSEWLGDPQLLPLSVFPDRTTFAVLGYFGPRNTDVLVRWLRKAKAIDLVCCLEGGCAIRSDGVRLGKGPLCYVGGKDVALAVFVDALRAGIAGYEEWSGEWAFDRWAYQAKAREVYDDPKHNEP